MIPVRNLTLAKQLLWLKPLAVVMSHLMCLIQQRLPAPNMPCHIVFQVLILAVNQTYRTFAKQQPDLADLVHVQTVVTHVIHIMHMQVLIVQRNYLENPMTLALVKCHV